MSLTIEDQITAALAGAPDSDERWEYVRALWGRGDQATFDAAAELLGAHDPARRALGADILGQLGAKEGVGVEARPFRWSAGELLMGVVEREPDPAVLSALAYALGHLREERAVPALRGLRGHTAAGVRHASSSVCSGLTMTLP